MSRWACALVRRPGPRLTEGLITHIRRTPVDGDLAVRQRQGYADALRAEGWETIEVPPADDCPDPVFVEDTAGLRVVAVDISEFERLEGCVTCLSVNLRGWPRHGASHGRARRTSVGCLR